MAFNQRSYIDGYNKQTYKMFQFRVRNDNKDVLNKLDSVASKNKYINDLILNDVHRQILTLKEIKERILPIMRRHKIDEVYLFGSYSRGEARIDSDVDIYCSKGDITGLISVAEFEEELQESLNKKVDVVFIGSEINHYFQEQLNEDKIRIL